MSYSSRNAVSWWSILSIPLHSWKVNDEGLVETTLAFDCDLQNLWRYLFCIFQMRIPILPIMMTMVTTTTMIMTMMDMMMTVTMTISRLKCLKARLLTNAPPRTLFLYIERICMYVLRSLCNQIMTWGPTVIHPAIDFCADHLHETAKDFKLARNRIRKKVQSPKTQFAVKNLLLDPVYVLMHLSIMIGVVMQPRCGEAHVWLWPKRVMWLRRHWKITANPCRCSHELLQLAAHLQFYCQVAGRLTFMGCMEPQCPMDKNNVWFVHIFLDTLLQFKANMFKNYFWWWCEANMMMSSVVWKIVASRIDKLMIILCLNMPHATFMGRVRSMLWNWCYD